jgi:hypothetical protein
MAYKNTKDLKPYQFKKGQSGNPSGRPKGAKNLKTILSYYLETELNSKTIIGNKTLPVIDLLVLKMIERGLQGDIKSCQELLDRNYGKSSLASVSSDEDKLKVVGFSFKAIEK